MPYDLLAWQATDLAVANDGWLVACNLNGCSRSP